MNVAEYGEYQEQICKKGKKKGKAEIMRKEFWFVTDLPVTRKNVADLTEKGKDALENRK